MEGHAVGFCSDTKRFHCICVQIIQVKVTGMCLCILGDGKIVLEDEPDAIALNSGLSSKENGVPSKRQRTTTHPVDLELEVVLGKMPRKVFDLKNSGAPYGHFLSNAFKHCFRLSGVVLKLCRLIFRLP